MPTYDYKCDACGHAFEKFQSMTSAPIRKCPKCGKLKVKRLIGTGAGLIFKGSGFYITDYRDAGYKEKAKADSGSSGDAKPSDGKASAPSESSASDSSPPKKDAPATKSDAKSDAKSESKSESKSSKPPKKK
jgi:putative FmdB family regulatory protein